MIRDIYSLHFINSNSICFDGIRVVRYYINQLIEGTFCLLSIWENCLNLWRLSVEWSMWFLLFAITLIKRSSNTFATIIPLWIREIGSIPKRSFTIFLAILEMELRLSLIPSIDWHFNIQSNLSLISLWICNQVWLYNFGIRLGKGEKYNIWLKKDHNVFVEWILMLYFALKARKTLF